MIEPIFAAPDPGFGAAMAAIGVAGTSILALWKQFQMGAVEAENKRLAVCEQRCERLEQRIWSMQTQLEVSEALAAKWQARCESLGWDSRKNSATKSDPA